MFSNIDNASVTFFRIGIGVLFSWWAWDYLASGRAYSVYVEPKVHFSYRWFDWLQPLGHQGTVLIFVAVVLLGILVSAGIWYRLSATLLAICFSYLFLLEKTNYQNHYYLMTLLAWWLPFLPLERNVAFDAKRNPKIASQMVPRWVLWILRFHIGLPYVYGGLAKFHSDWLAGEPMRQILAAQRNLPIVGSLVNNESAVFAFVWGGLIFDLVIVPLLLIQRTRTVAFAACVVFHVTNSVLFHIHVFPWFMIFATTLFFEPNWPRRVLGGEPLSSPLERPLDGATLWRYREIGMILIVMYCLFHCAWPFRNLLYQGNSSWTERGHLFSWRMMLRGKTVGVRYFVVDGSSGEVYNPNLRGMITVDQANRFARDPEMILQLAHHLANAHEARTGHHAKVFALVLASLNGRKPQVYLDPKVNLAAEPRYASSRSWVLPLTEPLRTSPWSIPLAEWEKHVVLPPLPVVTAR
ncbi:MAG: HTTM domain-containing protein [Pirellula sp.]